MRSRVPILSIVFLLSSIQAWTQPTTSGSGTARRIVKGGTLPSACAVGDVYYKTGTDAGQYNCTAANTWTAISSVSGSYAVASIPGTQSLSETEFATHAKWTAADDFAFDGSGHLINTESAGQSTLTQAQADMATPLVAGKLYSVTMTLSAMDPGDEVFCAVESYDPYLEAGLVWTTSSGAHESVPFLATSAMAALEFKLTCYNAGTFRVDSISLRQEKTGGFQADLIHPPTGEFLQLEGNINLQGAVLYSNENTRFLSMPTTGDLWIGTQPSGNYLASPTGYNTIIANSPYNFPQTSVGSTGLASMISIGGWQHGGKLRDGSKSVLIGSFALSHAMSTANDTCIGEYACGSIHQTRYYSGSGNIMVGRKGGYLGPNTGTPSTSILGSAAAGVGGLAQARYAYAVSWIIGGITTHPSQYSNPVLVSSAANSYVNLSRLPVYDGPLASTQKVIWRTKAAGYDAVNGLIVDYRLYQVAIVNASDTTYQDTTPDASLGAEVAANNNAIIIGSDYPWVLKGSQVVLGQGITDYYMGDVAWLAAPASVIFHTPGGYGTNVAGADYIIAPGQGTGSAAGGSFKVQVSAPGAAGTKWNSLADALTINYSGATFSAQVAALEFKAGAGTESTCDVSNRGRVVMVQGGTGVADTFRVCAKDASNNYAWTALY